MRTKKHLVKNIVTFVMAIALVIGMIPVMPGSIKAQAYSESGFLWNGVDGSAFVNTDLDDDSIGSCWYVITDNEDGGKSKVVFNQADPYGDGSTINDEDIYKYSGISGTAILDKGTLGINPFVYICFDIYGKDEKGRPIPAPVDIPNYWAGLSISYMCDCDATLELGLGDAKDAQIGYANPYVNLKANANGLVEDFEWKKFGQPGWAGANQIISSEEAVESLATVKIKIQAPTSNGGTFHFMIDRIGTLGSVKYTAVLEDQGYIITYEGVDGASFENSNPDRYTIKDSITLNNPSKEGYEFAGWTGTGLDAATTSVTIPEKSTGNRVYTANWTPIDYDITKSAEHGTFTVKKGDTEVTKANYNDILTLTATPDTGYKFVSWNVKDKDNNDITVTDNTFTMPAGDVNITAEFGHNYSLSDLDYGIELEVGDTIQNDEAFAFYYDKDDGDHKGYCKSFTITDYGLDFIDLNGERNQYPFPEGSKWFCFKHPYETLNGNPILRVWQEDTSIILRELDPDQLSNDGEWLRLDDVPFIDNIGFEQGVIQAISNRKENEQIKFLHSYEYNSENDRYLFDIISFKDSGIDLDIIDIFVSEIKEDYENGIKYLYPVRKTYKISKNTPDNGSFDVLFEGRESSEACPGDIVTINIEPNYGYELDSISVKCGSENVDLSETDTGYTFTMPEGDVNISAEFKAKGYIVTFKVEDGSWEDGSADDIVILLDLDKHYLTADQIPSVGENPRYHYKEGAWDTEPTTGVYIDENRIFTYTYKYKEEYEIVSDTISELPDAQNVSFSDKKAIENAGKAYNALSEEEKGQISEDLRNKLADVEAAFLALVEASKANPEIVNTWAELKTAMANGGAIKLGADITDTNSADGSHLVVESGNYVILDLNGHTIDRALTADNNLMKGYVIYISNNSTLDIYDTQTEGKITGGYSNGEKGGGIYSKGTLNMYGGTITGNTSVVNYSYCGGGIYNNGTFNMFDGTITGNNASGEGNGGGIYNDGTFNMYGGIISDNHAVRQGNDLYTWNNRFVMTGGTIGDVDNSEYYFRFVLSFDKNGGTGSMTEQYIMQSNTFAPFTWLKECKFEAPAGKKFIGWSFTENGAVVFSEKERVKIDYDDVESQYVIVKVTEDGTAVGEGIGIEKQSTTTLYAIYADKKTLEPAIVISDWIYGDAPVAPSVKDNLGNGAVTYTYSSDGVNFSEEVPFNAGNYTVKATIAETENYKSAEVTKEFSIKQRPITITAGSAEKVYDGSALTYSEYTASENGLADGEMITSLTVNGSRTDVGSEENVPSAAVIKNSSNKDVTSNYDITYAKGTLTVTKNTVNNVTVAIQNWTYGETAKAPTSTADFGTATYSYKLKSAEDTAFTSDVPTLAGEYTVRAYVAGTANYAAGEARADFKILQSSAVPGKPQDVPTSEMSVGYSVKKVSDISLSGNWVWDDNDKNTALVVGTIVSAKAVYVGSDAENYTEASKTVTVSITRLACTHEGCETEIKDAKAATCTEAGYTGDTYCKTCGSKILSGTVINPLGHTYGTATYEWSADNKTCTATKVCTREGCTDSTTGHKVTETVNTTSSVTTQPTCEEKGVRTYTATFTKAGFTTQTKTEDIDPTGHEYGTATYTWSADNKTCTATKVCTHTGCSDSLAGHKVTETVNTTSTVTTQPTCEEKGVRTYTAEFTTEGFAKQTKTVDIDPTGHAYGTATYTWSADNKTCTATKVCTHTGCSDSLAGHKITETVNTTSSITTQPTCEEKGVRTYTAEFTTKGFATQTKTEDIDPTGHSYGAATYTWGADNKTCTATKVCTHTGCSESLAGHKVTETVNTTSAVTTAPTCEGKGVRTYTATFTKEGFATQTKTEDIDPTGHRWNDGEITKPATPAEDGIKTYTCLVCHATKTETIPATGVEITGQPADATVDEGSTVKFSVTAVGAGLKYQWQTSKDGGNTWTNSGMSGYNTATLTVNAIIDRNGYKFRCIVTDKFNKTATSNAATLTVKKVEIPTGPSISGQPADVTAEEGSNVKFTVTASGEGLKYQWQTSKDGGKSWVNSGMTGYSTSTLTVNAILDRNGYKFRCIVTDKNNKTATSNVATLTVKKPATPTGPSISGQPADVTAEEGSTVKFTVTASGEGLKYQWQTSKDSGKTWVNSGMTGYSTSTLTVNAIIDRNGYKFRCVVTDKNNKTVTSNAATLTVKKAETPTGPSISGQPADVTTEENATVKFSVTASGEGLKYQWQTSKDSGKTWVNSGMTGNKTNTLTVNAIIDRNGYKFRCVVTDKNNKTATSNAATLTVKKAETPTGPSISDQPADVTAEEGSSVKFTVTASGEGLKYQWQTSKDGGKTYVNSSMTGYKTNTLTVNAIIDRNGYKFRCVVTDKSGKSITSNAATLTVKKIIIPTEGLTITSHPSNVSTVSGKTVSFSIQATGNGLTYQWQTSKDGGKTWVNSGLSGNKSQYLFVYATIERAGYKFRCVVFDKDGNTLTSNYATLIVVE